MTAPLQASRREVGAACAWCGTPIGHLRAGAVYCGDEHRKKAGLVRYWQRQAATAPLGAVEGPAVARPPGATVRFGHERVLLVPAEVALIFDANGWHAEAIPRDVDLEALCEAQDAEDADWFARRRR